MFIAFLPFLLPLQNNKASTNDVAGRTMASDTIASRNENYLRGCS